MSLFDFVVLGTIIGYLFGSIPFALIIGKVFYHTDVRKYGSGNLGSTNVARTLGAKAGAIVLILDLLKGGLVSFLIYLIGNSVVTNSSNAEIVKYAEYTPTIFFVTAICICLGHAFPIFANFKGGKCVASIFGILLFHNYKLAFIGLLFYLIVVITTHIVSLGSLSAAVGVLIFSFIPWFDIPYLFVINNDLVNILYHITLFVLGTILILRHIPNIQKMIKGTEKRFEFGNKKSKE